MENNHVACPLAFQIVIKSDWKRQRRPIFLPSLLQSKFSLLWVSLCWLFRPTAPKKRSLMVHIPAFTLPMPKPRTVTCKASSTFKAFWASSQTALWNTGCFQGRCQKKPATSKRNAKWFIDLKVNAQTYANMKRLVKNAKFNSPYLPRAFRLKRPDFLLLPSPNPWRFQAPK